MNSTAVLNDPDIFLRSLTIYNKNTKRLSFFDLNEQQEILLDALKEHDRIIVLKARQLGISTLLRAWFYHQAFVDTEPRTYAEQQRTYTG
jgi:hypothetical protein